MRGFSTVSRFLRRVQCIFLRFAQQPEAMCNWLAGSRDGRYRLAIKLGSTKAYSPRLPDMSALEIWASFTYLINQNIVSLCPSSSRPSPSIARLAPLGAASGNSLSKSNVWEALVAVCQFQN